MRQKKACKKIAQPLSASKKLAASGSHAKKRLRTQEERLEPSTPTKYSDETWSKERRKRLEKLTFGNNEYLDWKVLRAYGIEERMREFLNVGPWATLFEINEPAYRELTLEFLSTLKFTEYQMTFQVYGQRKVLEPELFGIFLGLYSVPETRTLEFRALSDSWPANMTPHAFWKTICSDRLKYHPSRSKASCIGDVDLKVAHHLLAHTIGSRKSSHGVVNNFEIFHLYSMANKTPINLGLEVAKYIYRQATDPRAKGIYCGGYITKFLKGYFNTFREPKPSDTPIPAKKISAAPFRLWGLVKFTDIPQSTPHKYSIPPQGLSSQFVASSSQGPSQEDALQQLIRAFEEERKLNRKEREKNKRFRLAVWSFLGKLAGRFSPPPSDLPTYKTSSRQSSPEDTPIQPPRRSDKAPAQPEEEEEDEDEDKDEEEDEEDEDEAEEEEEEDEDTAEEEEEEEEDEDEDEEEDEDDEDDASSDTEDD